MFNFSRRSFKGSLSVSLPDFIKNLLNADLEVSEKCQCSAGWRWEKTREKGLLRRKVKESK